MFLDSLKTLLPQSHSLLGTAIWVLGIFLAGTALGFAAEFLSKKYGSHLASLTKWKFDDFLFASIKGILLPLFLVLSFYLSTYTIPELRSMQALVNKITFGLIAFLITLAIARFTSKMVSYYSSSTNAILPSSLLSNITTIVVFVIGALVILQTFGISITPILTTLGIGGLAVALALQDTLANLFAGLYILLSKQVRLGDFVKLDSGNEGYISDITWRNTVIKTLPNNLIIIPNSKLASSVVTNYSLPQKEVAFQLEIGVDYEADLQKVESVTLEAVREILKNVPGGVATFEPSLRFHTFSASSINFTINMRAKEYVDQFHLKHECIKMLHKKYKEENISIPYPIQTVYLKTPTLPARNGICQSPSCEQLPD